MGTIEVALWHPHLQPFLPGVGPQGFVQIWCPPQFTAISLGRIAINQGGWELFKKKMFRHCTHLWCLQNPDRFPQDSFLASQPWRHGEPMEFPMTWRMLRVEGEKWECESKCATPSGNSTQLWKFPICLILSVGKSSCLSSIHEPFFLAILSNNQRVSRVHWKQGTYPKTSWVIIIIMWFSSWKNVLLTIPDSNTRAYYPKKINDPILCVRWKEHAQKPTLW